MNVVSKIVWNIPSLNSRPSRCRYASTKLIKSESVEKLPSAPDAAVAKVLCKHRLWLVARVKNKGRQVFTCLPLDFSIPFGLFFTFCGCLCLRGALCSHFLIVVVCMKYRTLCVHLI